MRLIHRRALTVLVAVALVSSLAVLPSVASAAKKKSTPIQTLTKKVNTISKKLNTVAANLKNVTGTVNSGIPIITQLVSGLQTAASGLQQLKDGLTTLSAAVTNTTSGLPGLNAARSQFGAFSTAGAFIAGTGAHPPAKGPSGNATEGAVPLANTYVVDFGNDVSARFLSVTQSPTGGASSNRLAMAVDCAASSAASTLCGAVAGGAADTSPNHVVVQFGAAGPSAVAADASWSIAAISG